MDTYDLKLHELVELLAGDDLGEDFANVAAEDLGAKGPTLFVIPVGVLIEPVCGLSCLLV
jgi:hypothetical protein